MIEGEKYKFHTHTHIGELFYETVRNTKEIGGSFLDAIFLISCFISITSERAKRKTIVDPHLLKNKATYFQLSFSTVSIFGIVFSFVLSSLFLSLSIYILFSFSSL